MRLLNAPARWVLPAIILIAVSCSASAPRQTRLMKSADMTISASALRVQVRSLAYRFSGLMEDVGERILLDEEDPTRRRRTLAWLTNGIPAMQQALFQPDPLAALIDGWFLVAQMRSYFASGVDRGMLPRDLALVNRVLDDMESDIKLIIDNAGPDTDYEAGRRLIYARAGEHPVDESFASRRGSAAFLAEFTASSGGGALKSVGAITETVEDLVARFDLAAEYLPKQARWQAMLFAIDSGYDAIPAGIENLDYIESVVGEIERLKPVVESLPELVTEERIAVLEALDAHLTRTLAFLDQQRATLMSGDVPAEREAVLSALTEERVAVLQAIAEERRIVLEAIGQERAAAFSDLDRLMDEAFTREVNKLFVRGLVLVAIALGGFAAITFLGVRAINRRRE